MSPAEPYPAQPPTEPACDDPPLRPQVLAEVAAAAVAPPDAVAQRLKSRLLQRIAAAPSGRTVQAQEGAWLPIWDGVDCKVLHVHGEQELACLLRFAPGAWLPAHRHPVTEECIVLEGVVRVGDHLQIHPGGYHVVLPGELHDRVGSDTGALVYLRGPLPEIRLFI